MEKKPLILATNDDGISAKGLESLIEVIKPLGDVIVVAPREPQSGMSHAITVKYPLRIKKIREEEGITIYSCAGTPVDCVKLAFNQLLDRKPDLLVSGINHGSNSATSVFYSGTMGAALEGCINNITSVGISLLNFDPHADFSASKKFCSNILSKILANGFPNSICLNINIPNQPENEIKGIKICRQNKGYWKEEFDKRMDPYGRLYYWLTGSYHNTEPEAIDTDEWALSNNYISIVPLQTDLTCYNTLNRIKDWDFN